MSAAVALPAGSVKLTGTLIGTAGSYQSKGNTIANTKDGNLNSYFDAPAGVQGWVGLDLGMPETITQVQFVPRSGYASRMVGGVFQASGSPDFSAGVTTLFTVSTAPANGVYTAKPVIAAGPFEYVRYLAPLSGAGNIAEVEFDGIVATTPTVPSIPVIPVIPATSPAPSSPTSISAIALSATDVHLTWQEDPSSTVNTFLIERLGPTDFAYAIVGTVAGTATAFDDLSVLPTTNYSFELVANNTGGASPATLPASATTPAVPVILPIIPPVSPPVTPPVILPTNPITNPWSDSDLGPVGLPGSATVNKNGSITVTGSGADIWNTVDAFNFESQTMTGNGTLIAQVTAETNPSSWSKSGIMFRENGNADARFVMIALTPGNGVTMQARTATHSTPSVSFSAAGKTGVWLELVRSGNAFTGYVSSDGVTWTQVASVNIAMVNNIQAGLCVTAHNNTRVCTATFSNVAITPAGTEASLWSTGAVAPMPRWESESFTYQNQLYVFGGYIDRTLTATSECDVYDAATNSWSMVTTMPAGAITHAAVTVVGDTVYIAGGNIGSFGNSKSGVATNAVVTYDITTGAWGSVTSLPIASTSAGLVCINNQLIYFGGINASSTTDLSATYSLDLTNPSATWQTAANMPDGRHHLGYVAINGIAYAVGGQHLYKQTTGNDAEVDAYNPLTNTWTTISSLPIPTGGIHNTTLVINNKIVALGGQTNGGYDGIYLSSIEEYDPTTSAWTTVGSLPEGNQGQSVAYINGQLIVADGTVDNQGGWAQNQVLIESEIVF